MENPASWNKAVILIDATIRQVDREIEQGSFFGLSLPRRIYDALKAQGYLTKEATEERKDKNEQTGTDS